MEMGHREYSRHRNVSLGAVQKAIRSGRITLNANGKIDSDQADIDWRDNTDASRVAVNALEPVPSTVVPVPSHGTSGQLPLGDVPQKDGNEDDGLTGTDRSASDYREHRATRERYNALKQQLEYEQLIGQKIDVAEAGRIVFTSFRALRDALIHVAPRIKDALAAEMDPLRCEHIVENEILAVLSGIDIEKLLKDQSDIEE